MKRINFRTSENDSHQKQSIGQINQIQRNVEFGHRHHHYHRQDVKISRENEDSKLLMKEKDHDYKDKKSDSRKGIRHRSLKVSIDDLPPWLLTSKEQLKTYRDPTMTSKYINI